MTLTPSKMTALGSKAPDFLLADSVSGKDVTYDDVAGDVATVVMFICNHCPYVKHLNSGIVELSNEYMTRGVGFVGISANDVADYPADGPEMMKEVAQAVGYQFPYLYDESQETAIAYGATCTPDFFIYDHEKKLVYRGRFDKSRPENDEPVNGRDFRDVLEAMIAGSAVPHKQYPSIGCNIKWKK